MPWSWRTERAYWAGEWPRLWRVGKWLLLLVVVLMFFYENPMVGQIVNWLALGVLAAIVLRRVLAGRDMSGVLNRRWREAKGKEILAAWPALAANLGLKVRDATGRVVVAGAGKPTWSDWTCALPVFPPPGLTREDLVQQCGRIAQAFEAKRVTVAGDRLSALVLYIEYLDALAQPFSLPIGAGWDGKSVVMGLGEGGEEWRLPVGPHTLVAGASGSGKASLVWGLLLGLAQPIREGSVEVWGIDRKGGMELAMGRALLTRFADDALRSVLLLEEAVQAMQERARSLAGRTRQHVASPQSPTVIVLIDELAALTSYETDRELLRRANAALATLASQGRAVGFMVFACLQDPRKETLPARGLFTQTVGLRLRDRMETAMVLGDGAVAAGALCHELPSSTPGVAYVLPDEGGAPRRVRAAYFADDQIREAAATFRAPHPRPIEIPAEPEEPARRPRGRRTKTTTKEEA